MLSCVAPVRVDGLRNASKITTGVSFSVVGVVPSVGVLSCVVSGTPEEAFPHACLLLGGNTLLWHDTSDDRASSALPFTLLRAARPRYLGETEAKLRALFSRARAAAPCILFLDELDAITAKRGDGGGEGSGGAGSVHARVLSTLLNEMDGVATTSGPAPASASSSSGGGPAAGAGGGVLVLAATNRRDALDAALLRPGRLHESVELGVPGREDREGVLRVHAGRLPLDAGVDLARLSQDDVSGGLTCADLEVKLLGVYFSRGLMVRGGGGRSPSPLCLRSLCANEGWRADQSMTLFGGRFLPAATQRRTRSGRWVGGGTAAAHASLGKNTACTMCA